MGLLIPGSWVRAPHRALFFLFTRHFIAVSFCSNAHRMPKLSLSMRHLDISHQWRRHQHVGTHSRCVSCQQCHPLGGQLPVAWYAVVFQSTSDCSSECQLGVQTEWWYLYCMVWEPFRGLCCETDDAAIPISYGMENCGRTDNCVCVGWGGVGGTAIYTYVYQNTRMNDTSVCEGSSAVWSVVMIEWLSYEWTPPMF